MTKKIRSSRGFTLVELMIVVAIVGILAALAIFGVKKYLTNAKTAEARNSLGQIGKDATAAWSRDLMPSAVLADKGTAAGANQLCKTSVPVPATIAEVQGKKYQASTAVGEDFNSGDFETGWTCLKFAMAAPQYYQYTYTATAGASFNAIAKGDLDGDGTAWSTFQLDAVVRNGQIVIAPALTETTPDE